jgi:hypothetical protein
MAESEPSGRKSGVSASGRASRRVGRYSIAPQRSSTAGVTRSFARSLARHGFVHGRKLARSSLFYSTESVEIRGPRNARCAITRTSTIALPRTYRKNTAMTNRGGQGRAIQESIVRLDRKSFGEMGGNIAQ